MELMQAVLQGAGRGIKHRAPKGGGDKGLASYTPISAAYLARAVGSKFVIWAAMPMLFGTGAATLSLLLQPLPAGRPLMQPLSAGWVQPPPPPLMQADTGGAAVRIRGFDVWAGSSPLIIGVDWTIMPNERWALLGGNGCGKSTLLRAIGEAAAGEVFEGGALQVSSALRFGMLEQTAVSGATSSVRDEVMSRMGPFQAAKAALEAAEAACISGSAQQLDELERAQAGYEA